MDNKDQKYTALNYGNMELDNIPFIIKVSSGQGAITVFSTVVIL